HYALLPSPTLRSSYLAIKARGGRLAVLTHGVVEIGQFVDEIGEWCERVDLGLAHRVTHDLQSPLTAFPESRTRRNAAQVTVDCRSVEHTSELQSSFDL